MKNKRGSLWDRCLSSMGLVRMASIGNSYELAKFLMSGGGFDTYSGSKVSEDSAMRVSAVNACIRVLAEDIGSLPLHIYRRLPGGGKERATDHKYYNLFRRAPNPQTTAMEWKEGAMANLALRGNHYSFKNRVRGNLIKELDPIHPDRVEVGVKSGGDRIYRVTPINGMINGRKVVSPREYTDEEIFHIPGLSFDGLVGRSVLADARESMGLALSTEQHGALLFGRGARPSGVLEHPSNLSGEAATRLRDSWDKNYGGIDNSGKTIVLEEGMKWNAITMDSDDAQFLETRKFQVVDIARFFRVPPHMIGELERATFSNIEQQSQEFLTHTLRPWLVRIEERINRDFLDNSEEYFAEFMVESLLRGDLKARYEAYQVGITNGILNPNEVRDKENLNPREGGEKYLTPMNMTSNGGSTDE